MSQSLLYHAFGAKASPITVPEFAATISHVGAAIGEGHQEGDDSVDLGIA